METSPLDLAAIQQAFSVDAPEPDRAGAPGLSAVMLLLYPSREGPALLYTRRTQTLRSHPGEISFPGGRVDPGDASPLAAALRETDEEVGVPPEDVRVLGHLTDFLTFQNVLVCAYVGAVEHAPAPSEPRSFDEVDEVLLVPVARLLDPRRYEARRMAEMPRDRRVHYFHVAPRPVWGITGELTARYLARAHGWSPPREARVIASPEEFLPRPPARA